jgi:hypothetical protein
MAISTNSIALIMRKRQLLGQTGGHTFGRGYPTITGKFTDEMTARDKKKPSDTLARADQSPDNSAFKKDPQTGRIVFVEDQPSTSKRPKGQTGPK